MSHLDTLLSKHSETWHSVARYSVYRSTWTPATTYKVIETDLPIKAAKALAEKLQNESGLRGFGDPIFGIKLENQAQALAAVRKADVWSGLKAHSAALPECVA